MSHQSVRLLLEDVAKSLSDKVQFGYGRDSEFNMISEPRCPYIWVLPMTAGRRFINDDGTKVKVWNIGILFFDNDRPDSNASETALIHDAQDLVVDQFMQRLDDWSLNSDDIVGAVTIRNDNQRPFYKDHSGIFSGWRVDFQLTTSDDFNYCVPDNIDLYAGNI